MEKFEVLVKRTEWGRVDMMAEDEQEASDRAFDEDIIWGKEECEIQAIHKIIER